MWTMECAVPFMDQWNHIKAGTAPAFQETEVKLKWLLQKPRANKLIYHICRKWYKLFGLYIELRLNLKELFSVSTPTSI